MVTLPQLYSSLNVRYLMVVPWFCIKVAFDQAAFLFYLAPIDGSWDECREELADFYKQARFDKLAAFTSVIDMHQVFAENYSLCIYTCLVFYILENECTP